MNVETLTGYHATYSINIEPILEKGFKKSISKEGALEWLGDGIYFWEEDYYAVQWNVIDMERFSKQKIVKKINDYTILKATIKVNKLKLFNMSSPEGSIIYNRLIKEVTDRYIKEGRKDIVDRLKNRSSKFWINLLEDGGFFEDFDVITAVFKNEKHKEIYKDDIVLNAQKQICVKNERCIKNIEIYNDEDRISSLYSVILNKRNDYYEKNKKVIKKSE